MRFATLLAVAILFLTGCDSSTTTSTPTTSAPTETSTPAASPSTTTTANPNPCSDDYGKLCPGVEPGEGRIQKCLYEHLDQLAPECREAVQKVGAPQ